MFLKHTPRPTVLYGHLSITYLHVPEACTLLYSPWTKVHTALTMFNAFLGRLSQLTTYVPKTLTTFNGSLTRQISFMKEVELLIFEQTHASFPEEYICQ